MTAADEVRQWSRWPAASDDAAVTADSDDAAAFVRAHTRLAEVPFVPEVRWHQAADAIALWQVTESVAGVGGRTGSPDPGGAGGGGPEDGFLPPPFWAFAWAGGQALARYLLDHPERVWGRAVLDLAAGSGLVAVAAALAGAAAVRANEIDGYAGAAITLNAAANEVPVEVVIGDLLDRERADGALAGIEVVLAGDVFYRRPMAERVLPFLERARRHGAEVLVGDPGRAYLPRDRLTRVAGYDVPVVADLEDVEVKRVEVWTLRDPGRRATG